MSSMLARLGNDPCSLTSGRCPAGPVSSSYLSDYAVHLARQVRALACLLSLGILSTGNAQTAAVCSNTPGVDDWILCSEDSTSTDDIDIDVDGVAGALPLRRD